MEQVTLHVEGMSCGHCVKSVEGSVTSLDGVSNAKVNLEDGTVEIEFDSGKVKLEEIKNEIEEQGYDITK